MLGRPHVHVRVTTSTNDHARGLAQAGAPHGTLVTASEQTAGRGRQGRSWAAPAGTALLASLVLREDVTALLPLRAAVAVAEVAGDDAQIKWPNDVLLAQPPGGGVHRKVAGILAEGRPQEGWAVLGIGLNVAVRVQDLPPDLHATAGTLGRRPDELPAVLAALLDALQRALALDDAALVDAWGARDALRGRTVRWAGGTGTAAGIDHAGRLLVDRADGTRAALDAGEVHLDPLPSGPAGG